MRRRLVGAQAFAPLAANTGRAEGRDAFAQVPQLKPGSLGRQITTVWATSESPAPFVLKHSVSIRMWSGNNFGYPELFATRSNDGVEGDVRFKLARHL
jgi:hypothetical protein